MMNKNLASLTDFNSIKDKLAGSYFLDHPVCAHYVLCI